MPTKQNKLRIALILLPLSAFLLLAADVRYHGALWQRDEPALHWVRQHEPAWLVTISAAVSQLGDPILLVPIALLTALTLILARRWVWLLGWAMGLIGSLGITGTLKNYLARPRPYDLTWFKLPKGYSFPSGHTMGAVITFSLLAYFIAKRWGHRPGVRPAAFLAAAAIALGEAAALVGACVHYPLDVTAALCLATAWVATCITAMECLPAEPTSTPRIQESTRRPNQTGSPS